MSLNTNSDTNSSWANNQKDQAAPTGDAGLNATVSGGLADLFNLPSMTSDNRNLKIVPEVSKLLTENYERIIKSTTNEVQRKILPTVQTLTSGVSSVLPGLGLHVKIQDTLYVAVVLFSNRDLTISSERITITQPNNQQQQVSIPLAPGQYDNGPLIKKVEEHYKGYAERENIKNVAIINVIVVDLEMLNHPEAGETKDHPHQVAVYIAAEWEEAIMVKVARELAANGQKIPSPFQIKANPYDKGNCAEARVSAVSGRVNRGKYLTAANMEVIASTVKNPNDSSTFNTSSREIARVLAGVALTGVSWEEHVRYIQSQVQNQGAINQFLGAGAGMSPYPNNYRPLRPVITFESAQAGDLMGSNGGLFPLFYGLYLLMVTNNQYVFAEALRKPNVGSRGNLSDLEIRIDQLLKPMAGAGMVTQRIQLTEKNIVDTDLVNQWIRQNVSPHATFQVNIQRAAPGASVSNFLALLAKQGINEVKTVVQVIDSMTNNKLSQIIARNIEAKSGWNPTKQILIPTTMITVNGIATYGNKQLNTQELDEMMICHIKGKNNHPGIDQLLALLYGTTPNEDVRQRAQKLRVELASSIFDGAVHINNFTQQHIWAPDFMAALGEAMDSIGQLHVANNLGSWRSSSLVYAPGVGLATQTGAGSNNLNMSGLGTPSFNMGTPFM